MIQYTAGYKFVDGGVHAQVLDFPAALTCSGDLAGARRLLAAALIDAAEAALFSRLTLPIPDSTISNPDMDIEEPIYLYLRASSGVRESPAPVLS